MAHPSTVFDAGGAGDGRAAVRLLHGMWEQSCARLQRRCRGLSDEELLWEPVSQAWNLVPDPTRPGGWTYPYEDDQPEPAPVTTLGWRLVHLIADNEIYVENAFGRDLRNFPDLEVHGTAPEVLADWRASREPVSEWLTVAVDADLQQPRPSHLGGTKTAGEVVAIPS